MGQLAEIDWEHGSESGTFVGERTKWGWRDQDKASGWTYSDSCVTAVRPLRLVRQGTVEALEAELAVVRRERDLLRALDDATVQYLEGWSPWGFACVWVLRERVAAAFEAGESHG